MLSFPGMKFSPPFAPIPTDKTIKMWRIREREVKEALNPHNIFARPESAVAEGILQFPKLYSKGSQVTAANKRSYPNAHAYHINSLSVNVDGETFISADDLRINLWNLDNEHQVHTTFPISFAPPPPPPI